MDSVLFAFVGHPLIQSAVSRYCTSSEPTEALHLASSSNHCSLVDYLHQIVDPQFLFCSDLELFAD